MRQENSKSEEVMNISKRIKVGDTEYLDYAIRGDFLYFKGKYFIPKNSELKLKIIREWH